MGVSAVPRVELFYSPTPNGWKLSILLAEARIPYILVPVDLSQGEQFRAEFLAVSPNGRIPAVRIRGVVPTLAKGSNGGSSQETEEAVFESGAIMLRLAAWFPDQMRVLLPACPFFRGHSNLDPSPAQGCARVAVLDQREPGPVRGTGLALSVLRAAAV